MAPLPQPAPVDLGCDRCDVALCPDLPALVADPDGTASPDALLQLAPEDARVHAACKAVVQECAACVQRGRDKGLIR